VLIVAPQVAWPQQHISSTLLAIPSQCALQYLAFGSCTVQVQAALQHFLGPACVAIESLLFIGQVTG
jgi:hypothetical protein